MRIARCLAFGSALCIALLAFSCSSSSRIEPVLSAFSFTAAKNTSVNLSVDVSGTIDEGTSTVTVFLPSGVSSWASLTPTITVPSGCTISPEGGPKDYSKSPVSVGVYAPDGNYRLYSVQVKAAVTQAAATALKFTEYYMGAGSGYEGELNRWIELTNVSSSNIDLSQYELGMRARTSGIRDTARDINTQLAGQLAAGASLLIYSNRLDTSTFSAWAQKTSSDITTSDLYYNTIATFDGDDGFQLLRDGTVLDCLGPNGGTGADYFWAKTKRLLRKTTAVPSATFDETEWVAYPVADAISDAANACINTPVFSSSNTNLTFFAFEHLPTPAYAAIDTSAHTASISVVEGTDVTALKASFSTEGFTVTANNETMYSGITAFDYSSPLTLYVWSKDSTVKTAYTVTVSFYHQVGFTDINYDFAGNIGSVLNTLADGGTNTTSLSGYIEGILTAKDVYASPTNQYSFFVQDEDAGILVLSSASISPPLGAKIRVTVTTGTVSYNMPEIKTFGAITRSDNVIHDIYYETGSYDSMDALGRVYRYRGQVGEAASSGNKYVGSFSLTLFFHPATTLASKIKADKYGTFYGPVNYSYDQYRLEISNPIQIASY